MTPDALREQWRTRGAPAPLRAAMTFESDALVLGAGTVLMRTVASHAGTRDDFTSFDDARLVALLSAAHGEPAAPRSLAHIRRAISKRREGETTLALIHLALSGAAKLERPAEGARRLFLADELMKAGIAPAVVAKLLARHVGSSDHLDRRYDPAQPRVPPGNGRPSGQWTSGDWAGATPTDAARRESNGGTRTPTDATATEPNGSANPRTLAPRGVQIADNSPNWARYLSAAGQTGSATTDPSVTQASFTPVPFPPSNDSIRNANVSCDDLWDSDKQICLSVLIFEDKHYHGLCMSGALKRYDECSAGRPLPALLPY
jgi:hypothetical protein